MGVDNINRVAPMRRQEVRGAKKGQKAPSSGKSMPGRHSILRNAMIELLVVKECNQVEADVAVALASAKVNMTEEKCRPSSFVFDDRRVSAGAVPLPLSALDLIRKSTTNLRGKRKSPNVGEALDQLRWTMSRKSWTQALLALPAQAKWLTRVLYLFTKTDVHNLVLPGCTINAVVHSLYLSTTHASWTEILVSVAKTFLWGYLGLLVIDVTNQLMGQEEDRDNKPFRPIVSGLIGERAAMRLSVIAAFLFVVVAQAQGVLWCALSFVAATSTYNFTGFDRHWIGKNLCNAWGYGCFFAAGGWIAYHDIARLSQGSGLDLDEVAFTVRALVLVHMVTIFSSITIQDLRDVDGDLKSRRLTQNLDWGERPARVALSVAMIVCTALGAIDAWRVIGSRAFAVVGLAAPNVHWALPAWTLARTVYYVIQFTLALWVGLRVWNDCPNYQVVEVVVPQGMTVSWTTSSLPAMTHESDDQLRQQRRVPATKFLVSRIVDVVAAAKRLGVPLLPLAKHELNDSALGHSISYPNGGDGGSEGRTSAPTMHVFASDDDLSETVTSANAAFWSLRGDAGSNPAGSSNGSDGQDQAEMYNKTAIAELKRAQYERDDLSFKLYILWLYLNIFSAAF